MHAFKPANDLGYTEATERMNRKQHSLRMQRDEILAITVTLVLPVLPGQPRPNDAVRENRQGCCRDQLMSV